MSVFANGLGVSGKAAANKTLAAMPDVCLSPPPPPAGPVPIPYPNFGNASDTTDGCTSVFVLGKEAGKKNASKYSKITGDEPATRSFGASVVTHNITGPLKFEAYSFDVIFEGGGAERFTDLTSTNHANPGSGFSISIEKPSVDMIDARSPCEGLKAANDNVREKVKAASKSRKATPNQRDKLKDFDESGTVSHALFKPASGPSSVVAGTSSKLLRRKSGGYFAEAKKSTKKQRQANRIPQPICEGEPPHNHSDGGFYGHSEPCIFKEIAPVSKWGKLTMAIDWHPRLQDGSTGPPSTEACAHCKKVIQSACKCMKIRLCNADGTTRDGCKQSEEGV
ncbi:DUF4150 domain-containing protein [Tabrizicola sp.]|jgi:hypothetical protein|uniref:DUF4150 domain-containing protein n=1 Tax=Tabrizicola sp. TaxID=2005166 RepID=UPI0035B3834B